MNEPVFPTDAVGAGESASSVALCVTSTTTGGPESYPQSRGNSPMAMGQVSHPSLPPLSSARQNSYQSLPQNPSSNRSSPTSNNATIPTSQTSSPTSKPISPTGKP
eukprot:Filipodium_phascolosomae@DN2305_c2_g1_i1.p1